VDLVADSGGLSRSVAGAIFYAVMGAVGFVGLFAGDAGSRFGLGCVLSTTLASLGVAALLLGVAQSFLPCVVFSSALFGAGVMLMSALLLVWSSCVFLEQPSVGFSAALFAIGIDLVVGPALLGALIGSFGLESVFLATAALALVTTLVYQWQAAPGKTVRFLPKRASNDLHKSGGKRIKEAE
jgi:MFS family permease